MKYTVNREIFIMSRSGGGMELESELSTLIGIRFDRDDK